MKKSYYRLARLYHPDRVKSHEKEEAKEKFNIIHNAYSILSNATKKKQYDNGSTVIFCKATVSAKWEFFLKEVNEYDIENARKNYQGTNKERNDVIREVVAGKGSLTHLLNNVPFMRVEDEARMIEIIRELIDCNEIPKMSIKRLKK